jgi:hypothetical protein
MNTRWFSALMLAALSLASASIVAAASECEGVFISAIHPVDMGVLRMKTGDAGWVFIDGSGASSVSSLVSQAANSPVSAGMIRVRAPQQSTLTISLALIDDDSVKLTTKALQVDSLHMYGGNNINIQQVQPGIYEVALPASLSKLQLAEPDKQDREVSIDLHIGVEARLSGVAQRVDTNFQIAVRCLAIEHISQIG